MEDNIQTIIVVIISAFILFVFPVYMAYEKKDDISYSLAMRYTQDLVDEVRSKGYITKHMYEDYRSKLKITGNSYDIQMTHEYNRYDPITNYYKIEDGKYILEKTTTREEKEEYEATLKQQGLELGRITPNSSDAAVEEYIESVYESQNIHKVEDTYKLSTEIYTTDYIVSILNSERKLLLNGNATTITCSDDVEAEDGCQYAYVMNVGDNFNVTIKNTNITLATVVYNMVTANTLDDNTRIYVNYGGAVLSSKWYGDVDYAKMKHDNLSLTEMQEHIIFTEARHYYLSQEGGHYPTENIAIPNEDNLRYVIEFEARPEATTELREKGAVKLADFSGYNFAIGNSEQNNSEDRLSISVGLNGVSLIVSSTASTTDTKTFPLPYQDQTIIDGSGEETVTQVQRRITDYSSLRINYVGGKLQFRLTGKRNVDNVSNEIQVPSSDSSLWATFSKTINNPVVQNYNAGTVNNINQGTSTTYKLIVNDYNVNAVATSVKFKRQTLLSYATSINDYTKIKVEFTKQDNGNYIALLYINNIKVAESIEMTSVPKVNIAGKTVIGTEENYFYGYIRNVKIYEMGD